MPEVKMNKTEVEYVERGIERDKERVKELEEALLQVRILLIHLSVKGHKSGYDWNSDPENLTLTEGEIHERITKALEG